MKRIILAALLLAAPLAAQEKAERITKIVTLKYVDPRAIQNVISVFGVLINSNDAMKVMALSGTAADVAAAEAAIRQLDVAPKNLELTVYFVVGGDDPRLLSGAAVPAELRDVITQLKNAFTFKDYRMMDVLTLRTRTGADAETSGILNSGAPPKMSQFSIRNSTIGEDGTIRLDRMHAGLRIPFRQSVAAATGAGAASGKAEYVNSGIDQNVDIKEGQKIVVGRSSLEGPERALFLILTARVIQ